MSRHTEIASCINGITLNSSTKSHSKLESPHLSDTLNAVTDSNTLNVVTDLIFDLLYTC